MQHVYTLSAARLGGPGIVAIGMFDGVHMGHQHLLTQLAHTARVKNSIPTVLTFFPHPDMVMGRVSGRYYLTTPEERAARLGDLGVEWVITHPFDAQVRQIRAADFVDELVRHLNLDELWVGADFAMGYQREGNVAFLREQGMEKGFEVKTVDLVASDEGGQIISSNSIRATLNAGNVEQAARWLGRPYQVSGEVVHGDQRGRTIGFPTANMAVWDEKFLPENGVYAGWVRVGDEVYMSVANVGRRPTFDGQTVTVEAHLLDFDRDIYGEVITFDFVAHLRPEMRFSGIDALVAQIKRDAEQGRQILSQAARP
ncbi:MAG TPA: bifunctional riboflavin kinase/FAD synthetase [Aggregatilinea sp.]|jgi:riboflavin kinase/FMN adenylyltransferase|uniref:bifunctional riboflavin kinase/FAD synthetase n=1 Tax=Aggregatilinea sp. TaxID=2806333 RepID=UPI002C066C67|nr:bifunctional riboflavin kinase/FAD synthetase [Aggregatilinea sp.]HML22840.1 bifunctional riboflavin kinase/FAD synthetase [Aggregatilinea sp.]